MTGRIATDPRTRIIQRLERMASRVQVDALGYFRTAELAGDSEDMKTWWNVSAAANEIVQTLKAARGAPGVGEQKPLSGKPPKPILRQALLDQFGVPPKID